MTTPFLRSGERIAECHFCEKEGNLSEMVNITVSRIDGAVLDNTCVCLKCWESCDDLKELFSIGVISHDDEGNPFIHT